MKENILADKKHKQLKALIDMAALVNSTLDIGEIKKISVNAATHLINGETGSLILIDNKTGELFFEVALEKGDKLGKVRLKKGQGIAGWVAEHGVPQIINDVSLDERFFSGADVISGFTTKNLLCVPVRTREKILGVLEVINKKHGNFDTGDLEILVALSHHVALAIENALLYEENIRQLETRLSEEKRHAEEKEKTLKDLHDGIGGIITNISLLADLAQKASSISDIKMRLTTISELSREGLSEIRSFMSTLDVKERNWHMLIAELRRIGSNLLEPYGIPFFMEDNVSDMNGQPCSLLSLNLFRIYREALTNIIKHARAQAINIMVKVNPEKLVLSVRDDGIGCGEVKGRGRGLSNMKARAEEIGGKLTVTVDKGTCVCLEVPLPQNTPSEV